MILHTIISPDYILPNGLNNTEIVKTQEIEYKGIMLEVIELDKKTYAINRILSTNPKDFLKLELQPGAIIELTFNSQD